MNKIIMRMKMNPIVKNKKQKEEESQIGLDADFNIEDYKMDEKIS